MLTFIGSDLVALRWKQWRLYLKDMRLTGTGQQMLGGTFPNSAAMYYPKIYNIEMDPHEDLEADVASRRLTLSLALGGAPACAGTAPRGSLAG